jgi:hypothetical protein
MFIRCCTKKGKGKRKVEKCTYKEGEKKPKTQKETEKEKINRLINNNDKKNHKPVLPKPNNR